MINDIHNDNQKISIHDKNKNGLFVLKRKI